MGRAMTLWYFVYISLAIIDISQSKKNGNNIDDHFRLPKTFIPEHYFLQIQTVLEENNFKYISCVKIQIQCIKSTNKITLHSRSLKIKEVKLKDVVHPQKIIQTKYELEPKYDFLHIHLNENLVENGWYRLEINFTSEIANDMTGYYLSSYKDESGHTKWIATTNFEPTNARRAFPCFDEPALRARFSIVLGHLDDLTAISNMPLKSSRKEAGRSNLVWDTFEDSVNMSTYLVAFTVNDFVFETTRKTNRYGNTTINVWAPKKSIHQVQFATQITPKILSFFEEYFDIAYPLSKSDLLAVPDFFAGAMENWGLITFRESCLLYVPGVSTESDKREIVVTIAHEISHYWFGDLVTIKWWTYLWLKEGFATYLARIAVERLYPNWKIYFTSILMGDIEAVYAVDALESSRPVSIPIDDPNTINEIFDSIAYSKGSCVIRMMELIVGNHVLRKGLKHYLNKYKYNSTEPDDLWNSLTIAAHEAKSLPKNLTVNKIMDTWTLQPGYPLVTVDRNYIKGTVTVTQKRFLDNVQKQDDSCYWVPLTYTTKRECNFNSTKPKRWLPCPTQNITFELHSFKSWIIFNIQAAGLYRVNYDKSNWKMIIKQLETYHKEIETINRVLLIDDVMQLVMTGYVDINIAFDLVQYVRHDNEYATWSKALEKLLVIYKLMEHTEHSGLITTYIGNLIIPIFDHFGGLRKEVFSEYDMTILSAACEIENRQCEEQANVKFLKWKQSHGKYPISGQIRLIVYCQGMKNGGDEEWNYLWHHYLKSNVASEKSMILTALGCTRKRGLLLRYLEWMIKKDSDIKPQDAYTVFKSVIDNKDRSNIARLFFYENVKKIYEIQSPKGNEMSRYIFTAATSLKNETDFKEYKKFLKENAQYFKMAQLTIDRVLERLIILQYWYNNIYPKIVHFLEQEVQVKNESRSTKSGSHTEGH